MNISMKFISKFSNVDLVQCYMIPISIYFSRNKHTLNSLYVVPYLRIKYLLKNTEIIRNSKNDQFALKVSFSVNTVFHLS